MPKPPQPLVRRIDVQNRVSIPIEIRRRLKVGPDDFLVFDVRDDGVRIRKARIVLPNRARKS